MVLAERPPAARGAADLEELPRRLVPRALFVLNGIDAHALWRSRWVCENLSRRGFVADYANLSRLDDWAGLLQAGRYNAYVTPRLIFDNAPEQAEVLRDLLRTDGMAWVYELDDDILSPSIVDHQLASFEVCRQAGRERLEFERQQRLRMVAEVDGVIASTDELAAVVRRHTDKPIRVVPNAVDMPWFLGLTRGVERVLPSPTVGWAGGARSSADLEAVAEAWARIARRYPEVTFVVFGERMQVLMDAVPKGPQGCACEPGAPDPACRGGHRRVSIPWVEIEAYPRGLPHIDIACCSVAPTDWNRCKSPDKFFEHTLAGAACVVSPTLYGPVVTDGWDGLVAETADEWERAIARLLDDPDERWRMNTAALTTVAQRHSMQEAWPRWVDALSSFLEDR